MQNHFGLLTIETIDGKTTILMEIIDENGKKALSYALQLDDLKF